METLETLKLIFILLLYIGIAGLVLKILTALFKGTKLKKPLN